MMMMIFSLKIRPKFLVLLWLYVLAHFSVVFNVNYVQHVLFVLKVYLLF